MSTFQDLERQQKAQSNIKTSSELSNYAQEQMASVKLGFIRKVYTVLSLQLLLTTGVCAMTTLHHATRTFVLTHPSLLIVAAISSIIVLIACLCYKDKYPHNVILLSLFTLVEAYSVGVVTATYASRGQGILVLQAGGLTLFIFMGLTIYTCTSKKDFSFMGPLLFTGLLGMIFYGFLAWLFHLPTGGLIYSCFGAFLFSGYIVYDTYMIMQRLGPDEWVHGAISLYLDILNLFLYILQILGERNR